MSRKRHVNNKLDKELVNRSHVDATSAKIGHNTDEGSHLDSFVSWDPSYPVLRPSDKNWTEQQIDRPKVNIVLILRIFGCHKDAASMGSVFRLEFHSAMLSGAQEC